MPQRAIPVILTAFLDGFAAKTAAADEISPANLLDGYGFSAVKPAVLSACHRIEKTDLPELNAAYRCWTEADHAFCSHLHQRLALVVYTNEPACRAGRQSFGSKP